ncbi:hypothetical protein ABTL56_19855, partial [Acinetobacter baumannii]
MVTEGLCRRTIEGIPPTIDLGLASLDPRSLRISPEVVAPDAMYRTARRTLNPSYSASFSDFSQLQLVEAMGEPVENLLFAL